MNNKNRDIESIGDTIGINLNSHLNFGASTPPTPLTPVITQQASPEDVLDNLEKRV